MGCKQTHILCDGRAWLACPTSVLHKLGMMQSTHNTMYFRWSVGVSVSVSARARARAHTHAIVAGRAFVCPHARVWRRDMTCYGADSSSGNSGDSGDSGSCGGGGAGVRSSPSGQSDVACLSPAASGDCGCFAFLARTSRTAAR